MSINCEEIMKIQFIFSSQFNNNLNGEEHEMIEEIGFVKSLDGINARVVVARKSSCCESCEKDVCEIPEDGIETEAINAAGAEVGQKVKLVMKSYTYYKGALLFYIIPLLSLFGGAILGKLYLPDFFSVKDTDLLAAAGGFLAFVLSFIPIKLMTNKLSKKTDYKSVIRSVVEG
jgi:positive regulator of sigma E activity